MIALALVGMQGWLSGCPSGLPQGGVITDPGRITGILADRATRVRSLRAQGSADQFGRNGRVRGEVAIVVQTPDRIRFDMFAFGTLVSSLVSDGQRFGLLQGRQYAIGPARACAARQLAGIPLEGREIAAVLSGGVPALGTPTGPVRWINGFYVLEMRGDEGRTARLELELPDEQRAWVPARQVPRVHRIVLRDREGVRAEITYSHYRVVQGDAYPERVRVEMPRDSVDMQVRFDRIEPGPVGGEPTAPPVDPDDPFGGGQPGQNDPFRIAPPAGTEVVTIDCV